MCKRVHALPEISVWKYEINLVRFMFNKLQNVLRKKYTYLFSGNLWQFCFSGKFILFCIYRTFTVLLYYIIFFHIINWLSGILDFVWLIASFINSKCILLEIYLLSLQILYKSLFVYSWTTTWLRIWYCFKYCFIK